MEDILIPTATDILNMSSTRCQHERIRLKNEVSFARGEETIGGPSNTERLAVLKVAIEQIEGRLQMLSIAKRRNY